MKKILKLQIVLVFVFSSSLFGQEESNWDGQGEVAFEFRQFKSDDKVNTIDVGTALFTRVEANYEKETTKMVARGFSRVDKKDGDRDRFSIEDLYWARYFGEEEDIRVLGGYRIFNWSAMEAFHPADVVNSRNLDSNLENFEKIGELTLSAEKKISDDFGWLSFYYWPRYEDPLFPGARSRLGTGAQLANPEWIDEKTGDHTGHQFGAMWAFTLFDGDLELHFVKRMDRTFPLVGTSNFSPLGIPLSPMNTPYYFRMSQFGGTYQLPLGNFVLKFEAAARDFEEDLSILTIRGARKPVDHSETASGLEYIYAHDSGEESTVFFEVQSMFGVNKSTRSELTIFQRDIFLGYRYAFNDAMGKELFFSLLADVERSHEYLFNATYTRRLSDEWKIKTGLRLYDAPQKGAIKEGLEILDESHYVFANLSRYF